MNRILMVFLVMCSAAFSASVPIAWTASTTPGVIYMLYGGQSPNFTTNLQSAPIRQNCGTNLQTIVAVPDGHWWFAAQAVNDAVGPPSQLSNMVEWATNSPPTETVSPPFSLRASSNSKRKVVLNWSSSTTPDVTLYRVYQGNSSGDFVEIVKLFDAGAVSYTVSGLSSRRTYLFTVSAANPSFESRMTDPVSIKVK